MVATLFQVKWLSKDMVSTLVLEGVTTVINIVPRVVLSPTLKNNEQKKVRAVEKLKIYAELLLVANT